MAIPSPTAQASETPKPYCPIVWVKKHAKPYLVPYYLTVAAVLGAITAGFTVVFVLLAIVTANFNVLGWME